MQSTSIAASDAFSMARCSPREIDVAEVHDAFSICEIMALEDLGLAERGRGAKIVRDLYETGSRKVNPRGGLIGTGHPLGATGIAQTIEAYRQICGESQLPRVDALDRK